MRSDIRRLIVLPVILLLLCSVPIAVDGQHDVVSDTGDLGYDSLNSELKQVYTNFGTGIDQYKSEILISNGGTVEIKEFEIVLYAYQSDHPEKFWASYFDSIHSEGQKTYARANDSFPQEAKIKEMSQELEKATASISISGDSMPERIRSLQDVIIDNAEYEESGANAGNVYGAFVEKKCKCDGYSLAVSYLCKKNNINSLCVVGFIKDKGEKEGGHAWNIIQMDNGSWYYLDATWDDVSEYRHRYDYFLIGKDTSTPSGTMSETRTIYFDYGKSVSSDKYPYDPFSMEHTVIYIAIAVLAIVLVILLIRARIKSRKARPESIEEMFERYENSDPQTAEKEKEDDDARRNG